MTGCIKQASRLSTRGLIPTHDPPKLIIFFHIYYNLSNSAAFVQIKEISQIPFHGLVTDALAVYGSVRGCCLQEGPSGSGRGLMSLGEGPWRVLFEFLCLHNTSPSSTLQSFSLFFEFFFTTSSHCLLFILLIFSIISSSTLSWS